MINLNDIIYELKSKLYLYTNLVSKERNIENISIAGQDVTLTITNHQLSPSEDAITVKNIKYKYPIKSIKRIPNGFKVKRFLVEMMSSDNPIVAELKTVELKNITTDVAYNGVFILEQVLSPVEFILQTTNNITAELINNEGSVLYAINDSAEIINALNGYKKITIVDNNTLKYTLNAVDNKYTPPINQIDFSDAKAGLTQQIHLIDSTTLLENVLGTIDNNLYTILVTFVNDVGSSHNGISNISPDVTNTTTGGMINKRDYFFDIITYSKKLENVNNDYLKKEAGYYADLPQLQYAIWQTLNRATFKIPFVANLGMTFPPILLNMSEDISAKNFKSNIMSFKISYQITPSDIEALPITTKIKSIDFYNTFDKQNIIHGHYEK